MDCFTRLLPRLTRLYFEVFQSARRADEVMIALYSCVKKIPVGWWIVDSLEPMKDYGPNYGVSITQMSIKEEDICYDVFGNYLCGGSTHSQEAEPVK
jgi:hypothetical protein